MLVLIYGAKGWIGSQFTEYLDSQGTKYISGSSRVDNVVDLRTELDRVNPTHVISLIGRTSGVHDGKVYSTIDFLEQPGNLVMNVRDNLFSPMVLAMLCKERDIHFTYLGTGCIFSYDDEHTPTENGFREQDLPNFTGSSYSTVKGYTDQLMHLFDDTALNLRIRMPITRYDNPRNFISKIIRYEKICSIPNSMTVLDTFFPVFLEMMNTKTSGTFNCTNSGTISHNEILTMYRDIVDSKFEWKNFTIEEQDRILDSKRSNNYLDTTKMQKYNVPDIHTAVRNTLQEWVPLNNTEE